MIDYIWNLILAVYSIFIDPFDGRNHGIRMKHETKNESKLHRAARIRAEYIRQCGYQDAIGHLLPLFDNRFYMIGYRKGMSENGECQQ